MAHTFNHDLVRQADQLSVDKKEWEAKKEQSSDNEDEQSIWDALLKKLEAYFARITKARADIKTTRKLISDALTAVEKLEAVHIKLRKINGAYRLPSWRSYHFKFTTTELEDRKRANDQAEDEREQSKTKENQIIKNEHPAAGDR